MVLTRPSLLQTLVVLHFVYYQSISPIFKENIKHVSFVKIPNLMVSCKQYFACSVWIKNWLWKAFTITYWYFFDRTNFFKPNEHFFQKFQSSLEVWRSKRKFSDNLAHNFLELYNVLIKSDKKQQRVEGV